MYRENKQTTRGAAKCALKRRKFDPRITDKLYYDMTESREPLEDEKKAALSASMRAASELPREEEVAENCADVRAV